MKPLEAANKVTKQNLEIAAIWREPIADKLIDTVSRAAISAAIDALTDEQLEEIGWAGVTDYGNTVVPDPVRAELKRQMLE